MQVIQRANHQRSAESSASVIFMDACPTDAAGECSADLFPVMQNDTRTDADRFPILFGKEESLRGKVQSLVDA